MKRLFLVTVLAVLAVACSNPKGSSEPVLPGAAPPATRAYGTLAEVMRGIPFPSSNIIFDTQTQDPAKPRTGIDKSSTVAAGGATGVYSSVYPGWQQVEQAAIALSETANLIMIPGRKCENGLPVPLEQEAYRKAAQGLADVGAAAYKAAKTKNLDTMVEISGTVSDACAACHEKYRDVPDGKMRCVPVPEDNKQKS
jgi:cytochrome c556